ncbi:uncharacterized protein LY79DRAFT_574526 [Colletotrichum navitas]|uniref:Uncharacterized protein n=1 Tax=Colletotrichum navitas TaxID=681940 RepID=A0AAD8VA85_9PEZI|nr:uncharacterized protein LY79DRAFT_574526 [Colletotrichum navitas]KAK1600137.1 hypothetical protein LY79DRAFT_574526 [Colletotrichum navitas]
MAQLHPPPACCTGRGVEATNDDKTGTRLTDQHNRMARLDRRTLEGFLHMHGPFASTQFGRTRLLSSSKLAHQNQSPETSPAYQSPPANLIHAFPLDRFILRQSGTILSEQLAPQFRSLSSENPQPPPQDRRGQPPPPLGIYPNRQTGSSLELRPTLSVD